MNILFFKKFGGNSEKERIIIFVMESFDKMDWRNQDEYLYLRIPCYNRNTFSVDLKCGNRFLSLQTMEKIPCPDCEAEIDYEIGPDESMEDILDTAQLLQKIEGEEEVEKMDALLSLAITGGDCNWI